MYGQQYLEWLEGEACREELQVLLEELRLEHGDQAYAYAINKQFPRPLTRIGPSVQELVMAQHRAAAQASGCMGYNPLGGLGRGFLG